MTDASEQEPGEEETPTEKERTKRVVRRVGRLVFIGGGFLLFVAMLVGVVRGIRSERAWNPYTGMPHREGQCSERARTLMLDAGELDGVTPGWAGRYRSWLERCKPQHPELYELLRDTRSSLQSLPKKSDE